MTAVALINAAKGDDNASEVDLEMKAISCKLV